MTSDIRLAVLRTQEREVRSLKMQLRIARGCLVILFLLSAVAWWVR